MIISNTEERDIDKAFKTVDKQFKKNLTVTKEALSGTGKRWRVRLSVKDSRGSGGRIGYTGRRVKAACWHVHGYFFEALPLTSKIKAGNLTIIGGPDGEGNWQDRNVGSIIQPMYYSEACDCY